MRHLRLIKPEEWPRDPETDERLTEREMLARGMAVVERREDGSAVVDCPRLKPGLPGRLLRTDAARGGRTWSRYERTDAVEAEHRWAGEGGA